MEIKTYRAKRRLKMGLEYREPGELAPEMNAYLRVDNYVHSGYLTEVWVSETGFQEAVEKYCPGQAERLYSLAGYEPTTPEEEVEPAEVEKIEDDQLDHSLDEWLLVPVENATEADYETARTRRDRIEGKQTVPTPEPEPKALPKKTAARKVAPSIRSNK